MVKRNALSQSVVASELAKSKGKLSSVAKVVGLAILSLSSSAFAVTTNKITTYGQDAIAQTGGTAIGVQAQADTNGTAIGQQATASTQATANGYVSAALANETIAIGVNSGAVGGSISKDDAETLKEIDNKITEYSKETPLVDPLTAVAPTPFGIQVDTIVVPTHAYSLKAWTVSRDNPDDEQLKEMESKLYTENIKLIDTHKVYSVYVNQYAKLLKDTLSLSSLDELKSVTEESVMATYAEFDAKKLETLNNIAAEVGVTPNKSRIAEIENMNPQLVETARKVFSTHDLVGIVGDERSNVLNNKELFIEAFNLISDLDSYNKIIKEHGSTLDITYNSLPSPSEYYNRVTTAINTYETALAEYNSKVAAYDEAVKNREIIEAERVVKLEEAIKELNTKATELGLGEGYANLSQVLGSLEGRAIAIGNQAYVSGDEAVGVGYGNTVLGSRSNVIGTHNNVTKANNNVMGNDNNITVSEGNVIVGNAITFAQGVTTSDNIALGSNTVISAPVPTTSMEIQGVTHNFAGTNPTSVLSIANEGNERQIQNVAAGRVTNTSTDAINGSQLYAVVEALNAIQTINIDDISDAISTEINITGGDNVQVSREGNNFTISATGSTLTAGDNITVEGDATSGYTIKATNTQSVVKAGNGVTVDVADNDIGTKDYTVSTKIGDGLTFGSNGEIKATGTIINAGDNITVTGDAINGYTISTKGGVTDEQLQDVINQINGIVDTNTQSTTSAGQGIVITETDNANGTKNYAVSIKATDGLTFDDNGNIKVSDTLVKAGENVQVSGNAKDGYTISATDTNTQATVSADKGITITETNNANGTKNYAVSTKLGKGLKVDENGAIAATAQPINGGAGVTITTNAQDEAVVNVAGVTTMTDDGKSYTRSDLTKSVGVKGDGKNISTSTTNNGDVQVKLADDIQVNSVSIHNGPTINQQGINAANTRITNVQDGVAPTDAVNVRQLNQQGNILNQRIDNLADNVKKNKKRNDAGIASTAAMANIPQVMLAGKSGVGVGVGHRSGQNAIAVGYSRASDNAKHIIKLSAGLDTQSKATFGAGYMYQW